MLDDLQYARRRVIVGPQGCKLGLSQVPGVVRVRMRMRGRVRHADVWGGRLEDVAAAMRLFNTHNAGWIAYSHHRPTLWHSVAAWARWELFVLFTPLP